MSAVAAGSPSAFSPISAISRHSCGGMRCFTSEEKHGFRVVRVASRPTTLCETRGAEQASDWNANHTSKHIRCYPAHIQGLYAHHVDLVTSEVLQVARDRAIAEHHHPPGRRQR